jgi:ribonuclease P protein component
VVSTNHRMRRSVDFATAVRNGRRASRSTLVVHLVLTRRPEPPRVGFVVNRAVGNAVVRNTVRRRLRHLVRKRLSTLPTGTLLVVRALPSAAGATSERLDRDIDAALGDALARPRYLAAESTR